MASAPGAERGPSLPPSKTIIVHSADGTRLHTEVFGPAGADPIVLAHGITCSLRVWHEQINDLCRDFRVIAYDHRGHGRSGVPGPKSYSLDHLAADLDAVLAATVRPGERAVLAGHSMGGIAISAWADRFRHRVSERAAAVALINTTTGDLLDKIQLLPVPGVLRAARVSAARTMIRSLGGAPLFHGTQPDDGEMQSSLGRISEPARRASEGPAVSIVVRSSRRRRCRTSRREHGCQRRSPLSPWQHRIHRRCSSRPLRSRRSPHLVKRVHRTTHQTCRCKCRTPAEPGSCTDRAHEEPGCMRAPMGGTHRPAVCLCRDARGHLWSCGRSRRSSALLPAPQRRCTPGAVPRRPGPRGAASRP